MIWTIQISDKEDFVKELSKLEFVDIEDVSGAGVLVLTNRPMGKIKRFFSGDWLFQIQRDIKTKEWYASDLEYITNCKDVKELQILLEVINKFALEEVRDE